MKKRLAFVALALFACAGVLTAVALAHEGQGSVTCTAATFNFTGFPDAPNNTAQEVVLVDGQTVLSQPFSFNGPTGQNAVALKIEGDHLVQPQASWSTNGVTGSFTGSVTAVSCHTVTVTTTVPTTVTNQNTVTVTNTPPAQTVTVVTPTTVPTTVTNMQTETVRQQVKGRSKVVKKVVIRRICPPGTRKFHGKCHPIAHGKG